MFYGKEWANKMFDIFRDIMLEAKGIDCELAEKERLQKKKEKEKDKIIFSKSVKVVIYVFSLFFIATSLLQIPVLIKTGSVVFLIRSIVQIMTAIATMICLKIHKKKSEIVAIVLIVVFFLLQYSGMALYAI